MHGDMLAAIRESVHDIAITMLAIDIVPQENEAQDFESSYEPENSDISAMVFLSGGIEGGIRLASTTSAALELAGAFFGEPFESLEGDAGDAFSELANMVAGGVQTQLDAIAGDEINLTPPELFVGDQEVPKPEDENVIYESVRQRFEVAEKDFFVEAYFTL
ncbi:MAG: chemotaxis protein CheX [Magnetococcales bacterium]|nr:chemotaxis protein CheX [Magnetococcales bacterium]